ncbi:hypothetical protein ASC95_06330 [Pelomonas sp. Root1217]|nr:hypothetical protein ASC95_06330 [Pelomonas sp. Root1217]
MLLGALLALMLMSARAGGSLGTDELAILLEQRPKEIAAVRTEYELSEAAFADIRFGNHFIHLGGARAGPYTVRLHRRAALEPRERELRICTTARYFDRRGRELSGRKMFDAVRIEETITAVLVRDIDERKECRR